MGKKGRSTTNYCGTFDEINESLIVVDRDPDKTRHSQGPERSCAPVHSCLPLFKKLNFFTCLRLLTLSAPRPLARSETDPQTVNESDQVPASAAAAPNLASLGRLISLRYFISLHSNRIIDPSRDPQARVHQLLFLSITT